MYVGNGMTIGGLHSHSIPQILSLDTGKISPQYHVVFDDWFNTVSSSEGAQVDFDHDDWYHMFGMETYQYVPDFTDLSDGSPAINNDEALEHEHHLQQIRESQLPPVPLSVPEPATSINPISPLTDLQPVPVQPVVVEAPLPPAFSPQREKDTTVLSTPVSTPAPTVEEPQTPRPSTPRPSRRI